MLKTPLVIDLCMTPMSLNGLLSRKSNKKTNLDSLQIGLFYRYLSLP